MDVTLSQKFTAGDAAAGDKKHCLLESSITGERTSSSTRESVVASASASQSPHASALEIAIERRRQLLTWDELEESLRERFCDNPESLRLLMEHLRNPRD